MSRIFNGRYTAQLDEPVVLFLIGMRINKPLAIGKWWPVASAMPAMLKELAQRPNSGLLGFHSFTNLRIFMVMQYWRSFDALVGYAQDREGLHFPAWGRFNKAVGNDGSVGIWHETYRVEPGTFETVYANMPPFGLAGATNHVPATGRLAGARDRMNG
jgi:hypothetical protein